MIGADVVRPGKMLNVPAMRAEEARAIREELGLTQSELAASFKMSEENGKRTIRRWETHGPPLTAGLALLWLRDNARKGKGGR